MHDKALVALSAIALALFVCMAAVVVGDNTGAVRTHMPSASHAIDTYYQENGAVREWLTSDDLLARAGESGGFTYNPLYGATPIRGYAVSLPGHGRVLDLDSVTGGDLESYLRENSEEMADPAHYFGGWTDGGRLYLDLSAVLPDEKEALKAGRTNGQLSIFGLGTSETIYLKGPDGRWLVDADGNWLMAAEMPQLATV